MTTRKSLISIVSNKKTKKNIEIKKVIIELPDDYGRNF